MRWLTIVMTFVMAAPAAAEVPDTKAAKTSLFSTRGYQVQVSKSLSPGDAATVKAIVPLIAQQLRQPVRYYAAIAWSPDDGLVHESIQAAMNYHSVDAAGKAAVEACMPLRSNGTVKCEVAAVIVPKRYKARDLTLSLDATVAFDRKYRKAKSPKAFATSRSGGGWGMGASDTDAVTACEANAGTGDCVVVIRD